jgi:hypothetical protein
MAERIAVETLTLNEVSKIFQESIEAALPKSNVDIEKELKRQKKYKITKHKWTKTYEEFKGAKLNFYCEKIPSQDSPIVSIGMTHRTTKGLILVTVDTSNGGIPINSFMRNKGWNKWIRIYTGHFCERFAERIMKVDTSTFQVGSEGIMFSDMLGPVRVTDTIADGLDEIEFQFKEGQAYGYRDSKSKITYFRTVYSNDMLKRERLDFKNEWEQPLEELYELFKWK